MVSTLKKSMIGYYCVAVAVVFAFMAFTLLPASADAEEPDISDIAISLKAPPYPAGDPEVIKDAVNPVKIGDEVVVTISGLPQRYVEYIRAAEPLERTWDAKQKAWVVNKPKHELFGHRFTDDAPAGSEYTFKYKVPCWASPSASKENKDQRDLRVDIFFKNSKPESKVAGILTVLNSKTTKCTAKDKKEPTPVPNYDAEHWDGTTPSDHGSDTIHPTPTPTPTPTSGVMPDKPEVKIDPASVPQQGTMKVAIAKLPKDPATTVTASLASSEGTRWVANIAKDKATNGKQDLRLDWAVPCSVAPGKYKLSVDAYDAERRLVASEPAEVTITKNSKCLKHDKGDHGGTGIDDHKGGSDHGGTDAGAKKDPKKDFSLEFYDGHGKAITSLPKDQWITIKATYKKAITKYNFGSVSFDLHSSLAHLGDSTLKNGSAQIKTFIPCTVTSGRHDVIATFSGKDTVKVKQEVSVTKGTCTTASGGSGRIPPAYTSGVAYHPQTLAKTGTAAAILGLLAVMFGSVGVFLIVSRRGHALPLSQN